MKKIFIIFLFFITTINAQEFGKNKVCYRNFIWKTYSAKHFEILYYDCDEILIEKIAKMAEQSYDKVTNSLKYIPTKITPLIIYKSHNEFEETNVSPDFIGEGVGGFTTFSKNRIVIPLDFSKKELQRIITHEFTHVVHLNFVSEQQIKNIPLWFMEGLAEYQASHWSTYEKMLIRDAILNDTFIPIENLNDALSGKGSVYLAYKEAHSLIEYIVSCFGEHKLIDIFRYSKETLSFDEALQKSININTKELDILWRIFLKRKHINFTTKKNISLNDVKIVNNNKNTFSSEINPQFSPDGKKVIYFSTKNNFTELFLQNSDFSKKEISLSKYLCGKFFENICYTQTGNIFSWASNSEEIIFIAQQKGKNYIFIQNIYNRKIAKKISVPLDDIISPNWYEDKIIFVGFKNGQSDIYSIDKNGQNLIKWTNDEFQENTPIGLPNNKGIIYSAERNEGIQIFLLDAPQNTPFSLTKQNNNIQPIISQDGNKIFFISDKDCEIFNLYEMDITGNNLKQITDINGGVFLPSVFENRILCNVFLKEKMNLYEISLKEIIPSIIQKEKLIFISPYQEKYEYEKIKLKIKPQEKEIKKENRNFIGDENEIKEKPNLGISLDKIFPYFSYDLVRESVIGFGLIASDLLGNKYIIAQGENLNIQINKKDEPLNKQFKNTLFMTNYFSFKNRLSYQIGYFNIPLYYLKNDNFVLQSRYLSGINFNIKYPFDKFKRLESGIIFQSDEWEGDKTYILRGLESSFIIDNAKMDFFYYPIDGIRSKYTLILVDKILGGNTKFNSIQLDYRKYHSLNNRVVLCGRIKSGYNQNEYDFYVGGQDTIRGYEYGEFKGMGFGLSNIEIRTLFFNNILNTVYGVYGVVFVDGGSIFSSTEKKWSDLKISTGLGLRMIFSFMPIIWRFDWAWTLPIKKQPVFYLYWNNMF
ncbi:MAG: BamA/TamA family outer membrane protein [bacterium]